MAESEVVNEVAVALDGVAAAIYKLGLGEKLEDMADAIRSTNPYDAITEASQGIYAGLSEIAGSNKRIADALFAVAAAIRHRDTEVTF